MNTNKHASQPPKALSIRELIKNHYEIPLYQRAYAWGEAEINTLLRDIRDARLNSDKHLQHEPSDYYIGSLVVNNALADHDQPSQVVDGQQRLTTLFIILALYFPELNVDINKTADKLSGFITFAGRPESQDDIQSLAHGGSGTIDRLSTDSIRHAAVLVEAALLRGKTADSVWDEDLLGEPVFSNADVTYLLDSVKLLQTELPPNTDLTHYFEIMNTRGEQLEKHEVLKSRLLRKLNTSDHVTFSIIWDACSVLDRHIQRQFSPQVEKDVSDVESVRTAVFGDQWDAFKHEDGEQLFEAIQSAHKGDTGTPFRKEKSLRAILETQSSSTSTKPNEAGPGGYDSIIDFPNLLLHVLKLQRGEKHSWSPGANSLKNAVRLEDKYLLSEFERTGPKDHSGIRHFAYLLLKSRFLMDAYVIRSQPGMAGDDIENWVIHHAHKELSEKKPFLDTKPTFNDEGEESGESPDKDGRRVLMLQTMFQVTDTRRASKHFLFDILEWLHNQNPSSPVEAKSFADFLESSMNKRLQALNFKEVCNEGVSVPNFLFNALDYHLWRLGSCMPEADTKCRRNTATVLRNSAPRFRFRYRTSVEHFYPVNPSKQEGHEQLPEEHSNHFGNLCLMSRSENSRRNNLMPESKVKEFHSAAQSLKFQLMATVTERPGGSGWNVDEIQEHGEEMLKILEDAINQPSFDRREAHE